MGVDKGHCTEGIRTGSLSNSPLEKKKKKERDRKKEKSSELREEYKDRRGERGRGGRGGRASEGSRQVTDRTTFRFAFLLLFILHLLIFPAVH